MVDRNGAASPHPLHLAPHAETPIAAAGAAGKHTLTEAVTPGKPGTPGTPHQPLHVPEGANGSPAAAAMTASRKDVDLDQNGRSTVTPYPASVPSSNKLAGKGPESPTPSGAFLQHFQGKSFGETYQVDGKKKKEFTKSWGKSEAGSSVHSFGGRATTNPSEATDSRGVKKGLTLKETGEVTTIEEKQESWAIKPDMEIELRKQFAEIWNIIHKDVVNGEASKHVMMHSYLMYYKDREMKGGPLHVAAVFQNPDLDPEPPDADSARVVETLVLKYGANIREECSYSSGQAEGRTNAFLMAAGRGNVTVLKTMLDHDSALVRLPVLLNGKPNYTALHEAAFFEQLGAMQLLIECKADLKAQSVHGSTPLHVAAKRGASYAAKLLVAAKADLSMQDSKGMTALEIGVHTGTFARGKLHVLARKHIDDVLLVAKSSPSAAVALLRDKKRSAEAGKPVVHESWRKAFVPSQAAGTKELKWEEVLERWIDLLECSPQAAVDLLGSAMVHPKVENPNHNPLPQRARISGHRDMRCWYCPELSWGYNTAQREPPEWHSRLVVRREPSKMRTRGYEYLPRCFRPLESGVRDLREEVKDNFAAMQKEIRHDKREVTKEEVMVDMYVVELPGIVCREVFHCMATTTYLGMYGSLAIQGILTCAWRAGVRHFYRLHVGYRMLELVIYLVWVFKPDLIDTSWPFRRMSWSLGLALILRDLYGELHEAVGYIFILRKPTHYLTSLTNLVDWLSALFCLALYYRTRDDYDVRDESSIISLVTLFRWFALLWGCRAFQSTGKQILPLMSSMTPMLGIIFFTFFVFMGLLHAFMALDMSTDGAPRMDVFLNVFGFLFLGDGDGIGTVLSLGGAPDEGDGLTRFFFVMSTLLFCIIVLNLFIAVHGDAYNQAQERVEAMFMQERAGICLKCYMRPSWPPTFCGKILLPHRLHSVANKFKVACTLSVLVFSSGFLLAYFMERAGIASLAFLLGMILSDMLVVQRPWKKEDSWPWRGDSWKRFPLFLWICNRADHDASAAFQTESKEDEEDADGTSVGSNVLKRIREDGVKRGRKICQQMSKLRRDIVTEVHGNMENQVTMLRQDVLQARSEMGDIHGRLDRLEELLLRLVPTPAAPPGSTQSPAWSVMGNAGMCAASPASHKSADCSTKPPEAKAVEVRTPNGSSIGSAGEPRIARDLSTPDSRNQVCDCTPKAVGHEALLVRDITPNTSTQRCLDEAPPPPEGAPPTMEVNIAQPMETTGGSKDHPKQLESQGSTEATEAGN